MQKTYFFAFGAVLVLIGGLFAVSVQGQDADTTAPAAIDDLGASDITAASGKLTWNAPGDDDADGTAALYDIRYHTETITEDNWDDATQVADEPTPEASGTEQSMVVDELDPSTTYYAAIKTSDEVPNTADLSNIVSFTTLAETDDETAPVLSAILVSDITETSATVSWTTDEAADSQVEYGTETTYGNETTIDTNLVTSHSVALSGLTADTMYHFRVHSEDASGNDAESEDHTFTTSTTVVPADVEAQVRVQPRVFNLKSNGRWITVTIILPEGSNAQDVDASSVLLNETVSPDVRFRGLGFLKKGTESADDNEDEDNDEDGDDDILNRDHNRLILKFSREAVFELVPSDATEFEVTISGSVGGLTFAGSNTIRILGRNSENGELEEGGLFKAEGDERVFKIFNGKKRHIPSASAFVNLGLRWKDIVEVGQEFLDGLEEDTLVQVAGRPQVYLVIDGKLYHIPTAVVFISYGFDWEDISTLTLEEFQNYTKTNLITRVDDPKVYIVRNGRKHWIPSPGIFLKNNFKWADIVVISSTDVDSYPEGEDID